MNSKPTIFSGEMVRAILAGRKSMTRRVIKPQPRLVEPSLRWYWQPRKSSNAVHVDASRPWWSYALDAGNCPYGQPGDRLWVRETWWQGQGPTWGSHCIVYDADKSIGWHPGSMFDEPDLRRFRKRPSIHMPRWASRITLEVTGVRVERVQSISEEDAMAEGEVFGCDSRDWFRETWDSINAKRGYSWESNPWVWCVSFRVLTPDSAADTG